ncbi:MAG: TonB family protein [Elusimicrobia bacterium]|jgi:protein TonB|nr:TonB family protein [Elusimicrobiota bacterium]
MSFKNSIIISALLHILIVVFVPYPWQGVKKNDWVEVSIATFPDITEQIPDYSKGISEMPEPSIEEPELNKPDIPVDARDYETGEEVESLSPTMPDLVRIDNDAPVKKETLKVVPGRRESAGLSEGPGKDEAMVISGPVARRKVLNKVYPEYPAWAEEKGVEGEVKLKFWVTPDGIVESVELAKTSGYPDFDSRALRAVNQYRFSPLSSQEEQKTQWGTIIIKYTLR